RSTVPGLREVRNRRTILQTEIRRLDERPFPDQPKYAETRISLTVRGSNEPQQIRAQTVHLRIGVFPFVSQWCAVELERIHILELEQPGARRNQQPDRKLDGGY